MDLQSCRFTNLPITGYSSYRVTELQHRKVTKLEEFKWYNAINILERTTGTVGIISVSASTSEGERLKEMPKLLVPSCLVALNFCLFEPDQLAQRWWRLGLPPGGSGPHVYQIAITGAAAAITGLVLVCKPHLVLRVDEVQNGIVGLDHFPLSQALHDWVPQLVAWVATG